MKWYPRGQSVWLHPRLELTAPDWTKDRWWRILGWHGGDEYGNCSVYLITGLLGGFMFFYELDFQRDVYEPDTGTNRWYDWRYYIDHDDPCPSGICPHKVKTEGCRGFAERYPGDAA